MIVSLISSRLCKHVLSSSPIWSFNCFNLNNLILNFILNFYLYHFLYKNIIVFNMIEIYFLSCLDFSIKQSVSLHKRAFSIAFSFCNSILSFLTIRSVSIISFVSFRITFGFSIFLSQILLAFLMFSIHF